MSSLDTAPITVASAKKALRDVEKGLGLLEIEGQLAEHGATRQESTAAHS